MGTYNVPRNVKGEGRILYIFSTKSLIFMGVSAVIAVPLYLVFNAIFNQLTGMIAAGVVFFIAFGIATFKIPEIGMIKATKNIGGQKIDDIIVRAYKFRKKGNRLYLYNYTEEKKKEEKKNG